MKNIRISLLALCVASFTLFVSCGDDDGSILDQITGLTPANDVELGRSVVQQIESDPAQFPILSETDYPEAYSYIRAMTTNILQSDDVAHKDIFQYDEVKIIHNDEVLNAFATPGGFIYVYTGLIKFLDRADDLAGVMGHEIAHASLRHSKEQLQQQLGLQFLISIALGDGSAADVAALASNVLSLQFSRSDEAESDEYSVIYLNDTDYACNGAATFFEKIEAAGGGSGPEFLSTHPSPDSRVADINSKATEVGCSTDAISEAGMSYTDFIASLPQ